MWHPASGYHPVWLLSWVAGLLAYWTQVLILGKAWWINRKIAGAFKKKKKDPTSAGEKENVLVLNADNWLKNDGDASLKNMPFV